MHFHSIFMGLKIIFEGVSDLNIGTPPGEQWQLNCCHVFWPIHSLPTFGFHSSATVPSVCRALRWRLQGQTLYHLGAVCLFGVRSTDLARKFARHRSLPQRAQRSTLSLG